MGNTDSKNPAVKPIIKKPIPEKYRCPVTKKIMVNPTRIISSGGIYDKLTIDKWIKSRGAIDPLTGILFIAPDQTILTQKCARLQEDIEEFTKENDYRNKEYFVSEENDTIEWEKMFNLCDQNIEHKKLEYQQILKSLTFKGAQILHPNKNNSKLYWEKDLLLLLSASTVPIISFIGPSRCGKSTLLNDILGLHNKPAFTMSDSLMEPETIGAWVALYQKAANDDRKEEKDEASDIRDVPYTETFFVIGMEGLSHETTDFTYNVFYAVYAISDVIVWNDKDVGRDHFKNLMEELQQTMSNISKSKNKPSFLYLRRDKNNFLKFDPYQTFDEYINKHKKLKSFRELNLFSQISGYQIEQRPGPNTPFSSTQLNKLMFHILALNAQSHVTDEKRFAKNYYELEQQLNQINKHGKLSFGTHLVMQHAVLKHFLFDQRDEQEDVSKILFYAKRHNFNSDKIRKEFSNAMLTFKTWEARHFVDDELKYRLNKGLEIVLSCVDTQRDTLEAVAVGTTQIGAGIGMIGGAVTGLIGMAGGAMVGGVADLAAHAFVDDHKMGDYTQSMAENGMLVFGGPVVGLGTVAAIGVSKIIQTGAETTMSLLKKRYYRYQLSATSSYAVKHKLMEHEAIPLFVNTPIDDFNDQKEFCLKYDQQLLPLISEEAINIIFMGTTDASTILNKFIKNDVFMSSHQINIPLITKHNISFCKHIILMPDWKDTVEFKKLFYSMYCIAHCIIWNDTNINSKEFESFINTITDDMTGINTKRTPSFIYTLHGTRKEHLILTKNETFSRLTDLKIFSAASGYIVQRDKDIETLISNINKNCNKQSIFAKANFKRESLNWFSKEVYGLYDVHDWQCSVCYGRMDDRYSQCIHCGEFNFFDDGHNNEYSLYRQLMNINQTGKISFELQFVMEHQILKYFLYQHADRYQDILMFHYAKLMKFNKTAIYQQFHAIKIDMYPASKQQLVYGKYLYNYALSEPKEQWINPSTYDGQRFAVNRSNQSNDKNDDDIFANTTITKGSYARLKGLIISPKFNGRTVEIVDYNEKTARWKVKLLPTKPASKCLCVRKENLIPTIVAAYGHIDRNLIHTKHQTTVHKAVENKSEAEEKHNDTDESKQDIDRLVNMGFNRESVTAVLKITDFEEGLQILRSNPSFPRSNEPKFKIKKALVMIIGVSKYEDPFIDLLGVENDVKSLQKLWETGYGFRTICDTDKGKWSGEEIFDFIEENREELFEKKNLIYDGVIICISSHGSSGNIISSDGERININTLQDKVGGLWKRKMATIPRIFIVDCCRVNAGKNIQTDDCDEEQMIAKNKEIFHKTNFLITIYGNSDGLITYCDSNGSYFVRSLVEVLQESRTSPISLSKVTQNVKKKLIKLSNHRQLVDICGDPDLHDLHVTINQ